LQVSGRLRHDAGAVPAAEVDHAADVLVPHRRVQAAGCLTRLDPDHEQLPTRCSGVSRATSRSGQAVEVVVVAEVVVGATTADEVADPGPEAFEAPCWAPSVQPTRASMPVAAGAGAGGGAPATAGASSSPGTSR